MELSVLFPKLLQISPGELIPSEKIEERNLATCELSATVQQIKSKATGGERPIGRPSPP